MCDQDFSIAHGGFDDVSRHVKSARHVSKGVSLQNTQKLSNFFATSNTAESDMDVIRAETLFAHFLVEHNIPISAADHAGSLFRKMFPGSAIAKEYASGRTKTTEIIKTCSRESAIDLAKRMKEGPFIVGTDGSQEGGEKYFPIVVRALDDGSSAKHS